MMKLLKSFVWSVCLFGMFWPQAQAHAQLKIGVAYTCRSGMAERVLKGFSNEMLRLGIGVKLTSRTELKDLAQLAKAVRGFERTQDGILIMRSTGAGWLANHPTKIPTFIGACNHPGQLGVIKNISAPEGNITGATYYLPRKIQWEIFRAILPKAHSIYLLLEKGHPSSMVDLKETKAVCAELGIAFNYKICETLEQAMATIEDQQDKVSAFVLGTQALYIDNTDKLVMRFPKEVFLSYSAKQVENGALGGFVADDYILGRKLAGSVVDVLVKGLPFNKVPVQFDEKPKFMLNVDTAERLDLQIPFEILQAATLVGEENRTALDLK